jgi:ASC-1-like (ASCH) protein
LCSHVLGGELPLLYVKKEVFEWLKSGKKTIDIRKGLPCRGEIAFFSTGRCTLKFRIVKTESGQLLDVVRLDNFRKIIPSAGSLEEAVAYLRGLYVGYDGFFCAYYVEPLRG